MPPIKRASRRPPANNVYMRRPTSRVPRRQIKRKAVTQIRLRTETKSRTKVKVKSNIIQVYLNYAFGILV